MPVSDHVIHVQDGKLIDPTSVEAVRKIVEKAVEHGGNGIVLHFHGGLVSRSRGMEIAQGLYSDYLQRGGAYPVFFVWGSGLLETLRNNLGEIAKEAFFRHVWKRIAEIVLRKFSQDGGMRAANTLPAFDTTPIDDAIDKVIDESDPSDLAATDQSAPDGLTELSADELASLEAELVGDAALDIYVQEISNGLRDPSDIESDVRDRKVTVRGSTETLMDLESLDALIDRPAPGSRGFITTAKVVKAVVSIAASAIIRFVRGRDHGLHATAVEEILRALYLANAGELVWSAMKGDTADAFRDDELVHGGTAFLRALADELDGAAAPAITLVGHSTGAIYISEFLKHADEELPADVRFGVVFLAPASTFQTTAETLDEHKDRIRDFRMFTMTDATEKDDHLVPVLYAHSLLYFISGVLEGGADVPIVGMQRFFELDDGLNDTEQKAIETVSGFIGADGGRVVWSVKDDGVAGHVSSARHHGDFDNDGLTMDSVMHILAEGF